MFSSTAFQSLRLLSSELKRPHNPYFHKPRPLRYDWPISHIYTHPPMFIRHLLLTLQQGGGVYHNTGRESKEA